MSFEKSFAVYINKNARRVSDKIITEIEELVPPDDIYLSHSLNDSFEITSQIIEKKYKTVFAGGGDGTITNFINQLSKSVLLNGNNSIMPYLGILTLGTGNAIARLISSGNPISDLKTYISNPSYDYDSFSLIESEGEFFLFAGLGWDAELLNDYLRMKEKFKESFLSPLFENATGYFASLFVKTIPRHIHNFLRREKRVELRIINRGKKAFRLNKEGEIIGSFKEGETIYEGFSNITLMGTIPYYGYGMKLLPFSMKMPDMMQVRVTRLSIAEILLNLPSVWKGDYSSTEIIDFLVEKANLCFSDEVPFQTGGDGKGYRKNLDVQVFPSSINFLKFI